MLLIYQHKKSIEKFNSLTIIKKKRIQVKRIGYAGTKDKRAKTSQRISFFRYDKNSI